MCQGNERHSKRGIRPISGKRDVVIWAVTKFEDENQIVKRIYVVAALFHAEIELWNDFFVDIEIESDRADWCISAIWR